VLIAVHEAGDPRRKVIATLGADLYLCDPMKGQEGIKYGFTDANVEAAAEAGALAGEVCSCVRCRFSGLWRLTD